jgi:hypothetical protein
LKSPGIEACHRLMTKLVDKAVAALRSLPEQDQDDLA